MKKRVVIKSSKKNSITASKTRKYVRAAAEDEFEDPIDDMDLEDEDADGIMDAIDDVADNVEDLQDSIDEMDEDDVEISINNNIADHFIAECNKCGGVFISAVVDSDQEIDHVSGICPVCRRDTDQKLKWVIRSV